MNDSTKKNMVSIQPTYLILVFQWFLMLIKIWEEYKLKFKPQIRLPELKPRISHQETPKTTFLQTHSPSTHTESATWNSNKLIKKEPRKVTGSSFCNLISKYSSTVHWSTFYFVFQLLIKVIYNIWLKSQRVQKGHLVQLPQRQSYLTISSDSYSVFYNFFH